MIIKKEQFKGKGWTYLKGILKDKASYLPSWASSLGLPVPWSFKKSLMKKTYSPMFYKITHLGASGEPSAKASGRDDKISKGNLGNFQD